MSEQYSVTIHNKSSNTFNFCILQTGKNADLSNIVVWLCQRCHPNTCITFSWDTEYCFFWLSKGDMTQRTDAMFSAWGTEPADPLDPNKNIIGFSYKDGAYEFEQTVQKGTQNFLQIAADATVPAGKAMIGIGMSENCIRCVPAVPNVVQKFELPSEYRVAFGSMKQGDPVDEEIVKQSILLKFPPNIFDLTVTLKEDNTWSQPE